MRAALFRGTVPLGFLITAVVLGWFALHLFRATVTDVPGLTPSTGAGVSVLTTDPDAEIGTRLFLDRSVDLGESAEPGTPMLSGRFRMMVNATPATDLLIVFHGDARASGIELSASQGGLVETQGFRLVEGTSLEGEVIQVMVVPSSSFVQFVGRFTSPVVTTSGSYTLSRIPSLGQDVVLGTVPGIANTDGWSVSRKTFFEVGFWRDFLRETFEFVEPKPSETSGITWWESSHPLGLLFLIKDQQTEQVLQRDLFEAGILGGLAGALAVEFLLSLRMLRVRPPPPRPPRSVTHRLSARQRRR